MKNNASLFYSVSLVIGDALAIIAAFVGAYILRVSLSNEVLSTPIYSQDYLSALISLLPFWILIFGLLGLYKSTVYDNRFSELGRLFVGSFIGILFLISYSYMTNQPIFPARLVTLYGFGLVFAFVFLFRTIARGIRRELFHYGIGINNVLLIGDTHLTRELIESLADSSATGYKVLGVVGGVKHPLSKSLECTQFKDFAEAKKKLRNKIHTIIQTELYADLNKNDEILTYAQEHHINYSFVPGNSELFVGNIEVDLFKSIPVITVHQTALVGWGRVAKRTTDIILGGLLLLLASPLLLILAVLIKLTGGGSVFFRQTRLTRLNKKFKVYKFRSQYAKYDGTTPEQAFEKMGKPELAKQYRENGDFIEDDPRVTPLGKFLRRTSLDELPQLINVVKGDISLVGPRALVPEELDIYAKKHTILSVKSGMTGLAQVSGRRNISFDERRKLDLYYAQNWSFLGDFVILAKTIWIVLFHKGAV